MLDTMTIVIDLLIGASEGGNSILCIEIGFPYGRLFQVTSK